MGENLIEDVALPRAKETGIGLIDSTMEWVRRNYNDLEALCDDNGLPKPPPWVL